MAVVKGKRLVIDENGNLLAHDPDDPDPLANGIPVAYHEGSFVEISIDEPTHNQRHHQQHLRIDGTKDEDMITRAAEETGEDPENYKFMINVGDGENLHHYETQEDDAHYDPDAPNNTRAKKLPDKLSQTITGHTDAWQSE